MFAYFSAELRYRFGRTVGVMIGVALGVALFIALIAAGNGFREAAGLEDSQDMGVQGDDAKAAHLQGHCYRDYASSESLKIIPLLITENLWVQKLTRTVSHFNEHICLSAKPRL